MTNKTVTLDIDKIQTMEHVQAMFHMWVHSVTPDAPSRVKSELIVGASYLDTYPALKDLVV